MKRLILPLLGAMCALGQPTDIKELLYAPPRDGIVATPGEIQQLKQLANAARNDAQQASAKVDGAMDTLFQLEAFSNRVAFVNGHILSFGEDNTAIDPNATAAIVRFTLGDVIAGERHFFIWVWFSSAVNGVPEISTTVRLETNLQNWVSQPLVGFTIENNVEVNGTVYNPVYVLEFAQPASQTTGFFRVLGDIFGGGPGAYFRVYEGGVQVGPTPGRSLDITIFGQRLYWKGGIFMPPPASEETP